MRRPEIRVDTRDSFYRDNPTSTELLAESRAINDIPWFDERQERIQTLNDSFDYIHDGTVYIYSPLVYAVAQNRLLNPTPPPYEPGAPYEGEFLEFVDVLAEEELEFDALFENRFRYESVFAKLYAGQAPYNNGYHNDQIDVSFYAPVSLIESIESDNELEALLKNPDRRLTDRDKLFDRLHEVIFDTKMVYEGRSMFKPKDKLPPPQALEPWDCDGADITMSDLSQLSVNVTARKTAPRRHGVRPIDPSNDSINFYGSYLGLTSQIEKNGLFIPNFAFDIHGSDTNPNKFKSNNRFNSIGYIPVSYYIEIEPR